MEVFVTGGANIATLRLSGTIDEKGAELMKQRFRELSLEHIKEITLDFSGVTLIGSAGIGKLLLFYKDVTAHGGTIRLLNLPRDIRDLFLELNLNTLFTMS